MTAPTLARWFDELSPADEFTTRSRTITEADVVGFAALSGDMHPQHTDREWARESPFGERVAHGMLVLAYAVALIPFDPERVAALRGLDSVVFKRPVLLGDTISLDGRVRELKALDAATGLVTCEVRVRNQQSELVTRFRIDAIWRRVVVAATEDAVDRTVETASSFVPIPL